MTPLFFQAIDFLRSDELTKEVHQEIARAQQLGVNGVPFAVSFPDDFVKRRFVC
jgi:predicted DsbA family dithiol-disulfide isomerase